MQILLNFTEFQNFTKDTKLQKLSSENWLIYIMTLLMLANSLLEVNCFTEANVTGHLHVQLICFCSKDFERI